MKSKPRILLIVIFIFSLGNINAQSIPFPSETDALNHLKASKNLANDLKAKYGVNAISELSIKTDGNGFIKYYSRDAISELFPEDMCNIMFHATTKKNSEGISYKIPILISFSRRVDEKDKYYLKNEWDYFRFEIGSPTIYGAKKITDELKVSVVYEALAQAAQNDFDPQKAGFEFNLYHLEDCIEIDSIYSGKEEDVMFNATEQRWELFLIGDFGDFDLKGTEMSQLANNVECRIDITVHKINGVWQAKTMRIDKVSSSSNFEACTDGDLFYSYKELGVDAIYKKRTAKALPRYSEAYLKVYTAKFEEVVKSLTKNETEDIERLSFFIEGGDNEIAKSIRSFYIEMEEKRVEFTREDYDVTIYWDGSNIRKAILIFSSRLERASGISDKALGKEFLAAGMSKKALKQGKFYENYTQKWELVFKEDRWYITSEMLKDFDVPF